MSASQKLNSLYATTPAAAGREVQMEPREHVGEQDLDETGTSERQRAASEGPAGAVDKHEDSDRESDVEDAQGRPEGEDVTEPVEGRPGEGGAMVTPVLEEGSENREGADDVGEAALEEAVARRCLEPILCALAR